MRVTVPEPLAIAPTNRFGELFTVADGGAGASGIGERLTLNIVPDDKSVGGQPGGNIRVAFLYDPERVAPDGAAAPLTDPDDQATNPLNPFFGTRLPLVADFTFEGQDSRSRDRTSRSSPTTSRQRAAAHRSSAPSSRSTRVRRMSRSTARWTSDSCRPRRSTRSSRRGSRRRPARTSSCSAISTSSSSSRRSPSSCRGVS